MGHSAGPSGLTTLADRDGQLTSEIETNQSLHELHIFRLTFQFFEIRLCGKLTETTNTLNPLKRSF